MSICRVGSSWRGGAKESSPSLRSRILGQVVDLGPPRPSSVCPSFPEHLGLLARGGIAIFRVRVVEEVFARAEEPVESDDGKVDEVGPAHAKFWVVSVENGDQSLEDGDVDRVCVGGRTVGLFESLAICGVGWILCGSWEPRGRLGAPRVGSTQCEDLTACCIDFPRCGCSSHSFVTGTGGVVADAAHDEAEVFGFLVGHGTEGVEALDGVTEDLPVVEGTFFGVLSLPGSGTVACLQTNTEIMDEAVCDGRWCRTQGVGCG